MNVGIMNTYLSRLCSLAFVVLVLSACGGGGGGGGGGGTSAVQTKATTITVIDGYIKDAVVCVDKNENGACDDGETKGTTSADGKVTLNIPEADVGKYRIVAYVPATAIDSDTGEEVGTAFTLIAPKEHSGVVSPFTTLVVQKLNANKNLSFSDAQLLVANSNGFELSVLSSDFMSKPTARTLARTLVALQKNRLAALNALSTCTASQVDTVSQTASITGANSSGTPISNGGRTDSLSLTLSGSYSGDALGTDYSIRVLDNGTSLGTATLAPSTELSWSASISAASNYNDSTPIPNGGRLYNWAHSP